MRVSPSNFIRAMHPKSEISPTEEAITRILDLGWVGQTKIHGHRAQIHVPADQSLPILIFTRQGRSHSIAMPEPMVKELRRIFSPLIGYNVLDAEWLKPSKKLFVFDILKKDGVLLRAKTFPERFALLPRSFISPSVSVLPLLTDLPTCLKILRSKLVYIEGLVFKATRSRGFSDTSIVRCRKTSPFSA
ncbi:MAG: hypothetical protein HYR96_11580 [Deltaproteobacteria bacterium]|nr:hypothetical protein [Deltaproteobacteria bacterium]MBI3294943.1 hypothetical protein [Deltaproteobacteria bacterium]